MKRNMPQERNRFPEETVADGKVAAALRALADYDGDVKAPAAVELRLMKAYREAQHRRSARRWTTYALALAAGVVLVMWFSPAGSQLEANNPVQQVVQDEPWGTHSVPEALKFPGHQQADPSEESPTGATKRPRRTKRRVSPVLAATQESRAPSASPREIVTQFFPLMDAPPPMERGEVWRVTVPASMMRSVGLPVSPDRWRDGVQADVLVGQEGMARAIRFVAYEQ